MSDGRKDLKAAEKDFEGFLEETRSDLDKKRRAEEVKRFVKGFKEAYGKDEMGERAFERTMLFLKSAEYHGSEGLTMESAMEYGQALGYALSGFESCAKQGQLTEDYAARCLRMVREIADILAKPKKQGIGFLQHRIKHKFLTSRLERIIKEHGDRMNAHTKDFLLESAKAFA